MKRYQDLVNSNCLNCYAWLCVTAGVYTGEIVCHKCLAVNVFVDSLKPTQIITLSRLQRVPRWGDLCQVNNRENIV
jgi:hypothetical protein